MCDVSQIVMHLCCVRYFFGGKYNTISPNNEISCDILVFISLWSVLVFVSPSDGGRFMFVHENSSLKASSKRDT